MTRPLPVPATALVQQVRLCTLRTIVTFVSQRSSNILQNCSLSFASFRQVALTNWVEILSAEHDGRPYWHNADTGDTTWVRPADIATATMATAAIETNDQEQSDWIEHHNRDANLPYWTNSVTGESTWHRPDEMVT